MVEKTAAKKWFNILMLSAAGLLVMALWFSASAVVPQLTKVWGLSGSGKALLTISVQLGFVAGAIVSAMLNLADRFNNRILFVCGALTGALFNAVIAAVNPGFPSVILLRFFTGFSLAGVYPPGMKLIATWCRKDLGLGIGLLIGALTVGSALPHLLNALSIMGDGGMPPWRHILYAVSVMAVAGGGIVCLFVRQGPYLRKTAPFNWRYVVRTFLDRPTRLATFGYLGHMWELYAMWAWVPLLLIASFQNAGWSIPAARWAGFSAIAVGAAGCLAAGFIADRMGRTATTITSLTLSGFCCLIAGPAFQHPGILTAICILWGFFVVADSAQFSAAVSELTDSRYVGTALTVQTSAGFLLTLITIWIIPLLLEWLGWEMVFTVLAAGPLFGIWSMLQLRCMPEAEQMASGNR